MKKRTFRTKKVLSGMRTEFRAWKEFDEGDVTIAKLVGTSQNRKNPAKKDWIVEILDAQWADAKSAKKAIGKTMTLNTAGQLDKGMEQLATGAKVQITYNGQQQIKGGAYEGQMAHLHEVLEVEEDDGEEDDDDVGHDMDDDSDLDDEDDLEDEEAEEELDDDEDLEEEEDDEEDEDLEEEEEPAPVKKKVAPKALPPKKKKK